MLFLTLALLALVSYLAYFWSKQRRRNFPPGPRKFPLIGSMLSLVSKKPIQETLMELSETYGPLVGLSLGPVPCVAVHGYAAVKLVSSRDDIAGRPDGILLRARSFNQRLGVLFSDGPLWKEHRRFTLRHLRDFGFGKRSMEALIHEEVRTCMENLENRVAAAEDVQGQGVLLHDLFPVSVINILWAIMAGVRYQHDNADFQTLMHNVNEFFRNGSPFGGIMVMPILRFVPGINSSYKKQLVTVDVLQSFMQKTIDEHKATYQEDSMRDFIDVFLREMKAQDENKESTFTEQQLIVLCMDLFLAGTETTSSSLAYIFLYLTLYPEVQARVRQEVHQVVGRDALPGLEHAAKLHYVQAVIHEVLRHASLVAMTPPHVTLKKVEVMGYRLPKNTLVLVNLHSVFREKSHWGDPDVFRPERHLNLQGEFVKDDHLLFFGSGPRFCLGEPLARNSTFLFLTSIVQRFSFAQPTECPPPNLEHLQGFTTSPRPYRVAVTRV